MLNNKRKCVIHEIIKDTRRLYNCWWESIGKNLQRNSVSLRVWLGCWGSWGMEFRIWCKRRPWLLIIIKNYITDWMMQFDGFHWLSNHRLWVIVPCSTNMVTVLSFCIGVRTGPGKPGKSWDFIPLVLESSDLSAGTGAQIT